ncbi:MAG: molybdopterin molybdotransferase [Pseudohongiellaceae bacterium]|jgi:molybdopterin molybdotransferase
MSLEEAQQQLQQAVTPITQTDTLALEQVLDRVLANDIKASFNVPGYNNSAMDGYALKAEDLNHRDTLKLIGAAFAGAPFDGEVNNGECIRIMTGAPIPTGANCVVIQEQTLADDDIITFDAKPALHNNIRFAGEDIANGQTVLTQGRRLNPADIGLLASLGYDQVTVYKRLNVALFSTGDELQLPGTALAPGCIYDSNRFVVAAMLERLGANVLNLGIIPDNLAKLQQTFEQAAETCNAIITSGGVSVGEADFTKEVLEKLGHVNFWKIAIKPGKPFAFGKVGRALFFGLPGNPVAATVTCHQLATPTLRLMAGEQYPEQTSIKATTQSTLKKHPGRLDFQRGVLSKDKNGEAIVNNTGEQGSGILSSMSKANCYVKLSRESGNVEAGGVVEVIPFDRWLS